MEHKPILPPGAALAPMGLAQLPEGQFALYALAEPAHAIRTLSAGQIGDTVEMLIAILDVVGGDPDIEPNGDELDGSGSEDDFFPHGTWRAEPGCPCSDPAGDDEEDSGLTPDWPIDQTTSFPDALVISADRVARRPHRDRIRATRCVKHAVDRYGHRYRLNTGPGCPISDPTEMNGDEADR